MSDMFHENMPFVEVDKLFAVMALSPHHTFQILTKRPERMRQYMTGSHDNGSASGRILDILYRWPRYFPTEDWARLPRFANITKAFASFQLPLPNVWLGVSVEDQKTADERIPVLLDTPAAVRFVSAEPLLGPVDFSGFLPREPERQKGTEWDAFGIDWVIVGGESGPGARPCNAEWIRRIVQQCKTCRTAVFVKQFGARPHDGEEPDHDPNGADEPRWLHFSDEKGGDPSEWREEFRIQQFPESK